MRVTWLISKHKITTKRLFPVGVSFASRMVTNTTEAGRVNNRRVKPVGMPQSN